MCSLGLFAVVYELKFFGTLHSVATFLRMGAHMLVLSSSVDSMLADIQGSERQVVQTKSECPHVVELEKLPPDSPDLLQAIAATPSKPHSNPLLAHTTRLIKYLRACEDSATNVSATCNISRASHPAMSRPATSITSRRP